MSLSCKLHYRIIFYLLGRSFYISSSTILAFFILMLTIMHSFLLAAIYCPVAIMIVLVYYNLFYIYKSPAAVMQFISSQYNKIKMKQVITYCILLAGKVLETLLIVIIVISNL